MNTDPPYNVKVEPRSNNAIAAGLSSFTSTHHQSLDLARDPGKAKPTGKMRAKDRPLLNDFVSEADFERMLLAWFGNLAYAMEPGRGVLHLGRLRELRELPAGAEGLGALLQPGDHLDQGAPGPDAEGLHGQPRVVLLRLAGRGRAPVLRAEQRRRHLGNPQGEPAIHGPPDREAGRTRRAGDRVLLPPRRERPRPLRRLGLDAHGLRAHRAEGVPDGARPGLLRRHRPTVGGEDAARGDPRRRRPDLRAALGDAGALGGSPCRVTRPTS